MLNLITLIFLTIFFFASLASLNILIARTHPSSLRMIWYLFSLSFVVTAEVGLHARHINAINEQGQFVGDYEHILQLGLELMSDLKTDVLVFVGVLIAVILPQMLSYVLSGFFGCASIPLFEGRSTTLFVWALIKSFTACSGIWFAIAILGGTGMFSVPNNLGMGSFSALLLLLAFSILWIYEEGKSILGDILGGANKRWPCLVRPFLITHHWFIRRQKSETLVRWNLPW